MRCIPFSTLVFFIICTWTPLQASSPATDPVQVALIDLLDNRAIPNDFNQLFQNGYFAWDQKLVELYEQQDMKPLWITSAGPDEKARIIANALIASYGEGLDPENYFIAAITRLWTSTSPSELALLDILLTHGLKEYLNDMAYGRAEPCQLDPKLFAAARDSLNNDSPQLVLEAYQAADLERFLHSQIPAHSSYQLLRNALAEYRMIAEQGGWQEIQAGSPLIKPGNEDQRVPAIRSRLAVTKDFTGTALSSSLYDEPLEDAVKRFQARHNLKVDGVVGPNTFKAMNVPVEKRIDQILINLERWRWLPHNLAGNRIFVNIAGFYLRAAFNEKEVFSMPVIVGKVYHKTPVFSDRIRYIEFNPFWNIPNSIAKNEILPDLLKNPAYLQENNIRLFDGWAENAPEIDPSTINWRETGRGITRFRLRQDPGPDNSLGRVKFVFPNRFNVYMHDTPARNLFELDDRAFSHGCIRVSKPIEFALYLLSLDDGEWSMEKIQQILDSKKRTIVVLKKPIPVHILYRTVIVDPDTGTISFYTDIYGRDSLLLQALFPRGATEVCKYPPINK